MNLLLDTHVLLWWLSADPRLTKAARKTIKDATVVYVSAATAWEIAIKTSLGKLDFQGDLEHELALNDFRAMPITIAHALAVESLPPHHADPFDRMLVAQARVESVLLFTADRRLLTYGAEIKLA